MKFIYLKVSLGLALTFLIGAAAGSLGTLHEIRSVARQFVHPDTLNARILARLDSRLGLNTEQHQQMAQALEQLQPEYDAMRAEAKKNRQALLDDFQAKVSLFLTEDQKKKLEQLRHDRTERIQTFLGTAKA